MKIVLANLTGTNLLVQLDGTDWIFPPGCSCIETLASQATIEANGTHFIDLDNAWGSQITVGLDGVHQYQNPSGLQIWFAGFGLVLTLALVCWTLKMLRHVGGVRTSVPEL